MAERRAGEVLPVRRALLSAADKAGLPELARALAELGVELLSTGSTARALRDAGLAVTPVAEVTGFPELLDGRVKTLHPRIHAAILADRANPEHVRQLEEHGIPPIDLVVVNLYPFREAVAAGAAEPEVIEQIDVGGPAMVRAAAKNHGSVGVVVRPERYPEVVGELRREGGLSLDTRRRLAAEAFAHTAAYDAAIASWFASRLAGEALPGFVGLALEKEADLRYGENPHQRGALYREAGGPGPLGGARVLQGKGMSFNNWLDAWAASSLAAALPRPAAVIVKHNNPCGAALGPSAAEAYRRALAGDPVSAFGGVVAFNVEVDAEAASATAEVFTEVVAAPAFDAGARGAFASREALRLVELPPELPGGLDVRPIPGGALVQDRDAVTEALAEARVVSTRAPTEREWADLELAWTVAAAVRSNAIVLVRDGATVGIGAGQMSRVDASFLAVRKAGDRARGAVLASDAFFPFPDALEVAGDAGVTAVVHPGGSVRDEEVLRAAEARGMAVVVTGRRHFRH
ncbi:MAG TPA: bifunctional phosphoribosylaminoimidazolecarboxamide formyltransferase/IMP cyclohydrolase [Actinomycetota bacterium]|nr:bifunctional phosphoribosylaminoimidazolecarboxamide formyltransferase/IMP cyclohydrolase [Actinomycetota bacterium]